MARPLPRKFTRLFTMTLKPVVEGGEESGCIQVSHRIMTSYWCAIELASISGETHVAPPDGFFFKRVGELSLKGLPTLFRKFYSYKASETTIVGSLRQVERFPSLHEAQSCSTVMY